MEHDSGVDSIKVLLVEDNPGDARLTRLALAEAGRDRFSVKHVERLSEALLCLCEEEFNVVLLDLSLPDSHGLETFTRMYEQSSHVPIIALTGLTDEKMAIKAMQQGAQDYLSKDEVDTQRLVRTIRYAIERKRMAVALRESEEKYRLLAENISDVIWTMDLNLQFTYISPSVSRVTDFVQEELICMTLPELIPPDALGILLKIFADEIGNDNERDPLRTKVMEIPLFRKNGSIRWTEQSVRLLRNSEGNPIGLQGISRDVSERKQAEENLKESEKKFRMVFENAHDEILLADGSGTVLDINDRVTDIFGYTPEDLIGINVLEMGVFNEEDIGWLTQMFVSAVESGKVIGKIELDAIHKEGHKISVEVKTSLIWKNDRIEGVIVFIRDITEHKQAEEMLKSKNEELQAIEEELREVNENLESKVTERTYEIERLLKQKEGFISQLGHDLRSPLTPLNALTPMLYEEEADPKKRELLDVIVCNVKYMKDLVEKTLQLAKLNSGNVTLEIEDIKLSRIPDELIRRKQDIFNQSGVVVENTIDERIVVVADRLRLSEVFDNLSTNAIKFMPEGGTLTFSASEYGELAIISVKDTGIGLTSKQIDYIFDEFYKADQSRHDLDSSGLGLTICKRILEKHDGGIWAESDGLGKGTTFYFTVPLRIGIVNMATMALNDWNELEPESSVMSQ